MLTVEWRPELHPRDRLGRFLEKGDIVDILGPMLRPAGRGRVVGSSRSADHSVYVNVELDDGTISEVPASRVKTVPRKADLSTTAHPTIATPAEELQVGDGVLLPDTGDTVHEVMSHEVVGDQVRLTTRDSQTGETREHETPRTSIWQKIMRTLATTAMLFGLMFGGIHAMPQQDASPPTPDVTTSQVVEVERAPAPTTAAGYHRMFSQLDPDEWGGGDNAQSVSISGGRRVWIFADTFSGNNGFVHSTAIVQDGGVLHVSNGGAQVLPNGPTSNTLYGGQRQIVYWPEKVVAQTDGTIKIYAAPMSIGFSNPWDFRRDDQRSKVATVSVDEAGDLHFEGWEGYEPAPSDSTIVHGGDDFKAIGPHHFTYQGRTHDIKLANGQYLRTTSQNWDDPLENHLNPDGSLRYSDWAPIFSAVDAPPGLTSAAVSYYWNPALHPRDRSGRFLEKFEVVDVLSATLSHLGRGRVVGNARGGFVDVELENGTYAEVPSYRVVGAPEPKADLYPDVPAYTEPASGLPVETPLPPGTAIPGTHYEGIDKPTEAMCWCSRGHKHWGTLGAAGMLIRHTDSQGVTRYLMQKRSPWVQCPNTWSVPGGAITPGHTAVDTGFIEAEEELGEIPPLKPIRTVTVDHGGWSYTTVIAEVEEIFEPGGEGSTAWEQSGVGWFTREELSDIPLHPGFESTLPVIDRSEAQASLVAAAGAVYSLLDALKKAVPHWDPAKHPRDRLGQWIETGDFVHAYHDATAPLPEASGKIMASYFDQPTGRMFIGVDTGGGQLKWYRPKQLEHVQAKAHLTTPPKLPLPALDSKEDTVHWDIVPDATPNDLEQVKAGHTPLTTLKALSGPQMKKIGLEHVPEGSVAPQKDSSKFHLPPGKTPDDMLGLLTTTLINKNLQDSYPGGLVQWNADFDSMLADTDFDSASKKLAKLMTAAKLGGKQRKRYIAFLEKKHGGSSGAMETVGLPHVEDDTLEQAAPSVAKIEPAPTPAPTAPDEPPVTTTLHNGLGGVAEVTQAPDSGWDIWLTYSDNVQDHAHEATHDEAINEATKLLTADVMMNALPDESMVNKFEEDIIAGDTDPHYLAQIVANPVMIGTEGPTQYASAKKALIELYNSEDFGDTVGFEVMKESQIPEEEWITGETPYYDVEVTEDPFVNAMNQMEAVTDYLPITFDQWVKDLESGSVDEKAAIVQIAGDSGPDGLSPPGGAKKQNTAIKALLAVYGVTQGKTVTLTDLDKGGVPGYAGMGEFETEDIQHPPGTVDPQTGAYVVDVPGSQLALVNGYLTQLEAGNKDFVISDAKNASLAENRASAKEALLKTYLYVHAGGGVDALDIAEVGITTPLFPGAGIGEGPSDLPAKPEKAKPKWPGPADIGPYDAVYSHPQGSVIVVSDAGFKVTKYKPDGKKASTSATASNLAEGHGAWAYVGTGPEAIKAWESGQEAVVAPPKVAAPAKKAAPPAPKPAPEPAPASEPAQPKGVAFHPEEYKTLKLLVTTLVNKGQWDGIAVNDWNLVCAADVSYQDAAVALAKLMTKAKLGGKQRKRYKDALAKAYGVQVGNSAAAPKASAAPPTPKPGEWAPVIPAGATALKDPKYVTGPTKGNKLVNPGGGFTPEKAKQTIQDTLSERMKGKVSTTQLVNAVLKTKYNYTQEIKDLAKAVQAGEVKPPFQSIERGIYGNWTLSTHPPTAGTKRLAPTAANLEFALRSTVANSLIKLWAQSSNDSNVRSLAMQEAAIEEFGLKDTYPWSESYVSKADIQHELDTQRALFRTFLRAMYDHTQQWAKSNGVTHVRLTRGSAMYAGPVGSTVKVKLRPMSSFTSNKGTANGFGTSRISAIVPIEWVIGTAATGFGCQSEYEWVVLGGVHEVRVVG